MTSTSLASATQLFYQTHSPFARKALVFAYETGIAHQLTVVHKETSPTRTDAQVFAANPLGKVPVLLEPGRPALFDSDVICAYLDTRHGGPSLIPLGETRWFALQLQAVAQGLAEAGIQLRWETVRRPEALRYEPLRNGYEKKLQASYDWLEAISDTIDLSVGAIALATTLDWLEFRDLPGFRVGRPRLTQWFERFADRPSMRATTLSGETWD